MRENRDASLDFTLAEEGEELRRDRQWATRWGLSLTALSGFRRTPVTAIMFDRFDRAEARECYEQLWDNHQLDRFPPGVDYFYFDSGITCGFDTVMRWLSLVLYEEKLEDAFLSNADLDKDEADLTVQKLAFLRRRRHRCEPGWAQYQSIRTNRVNRVQRRVGQMLLTAEGRERLHV